MSSPDYYQVLHVPPTASPEDIKKAYRKLALQYHPDTAADNTELTAQRFAEIQQAYEILSNPATRQTYHYQRFYTDYRSRPVLTAQRILRQSTELAQLVKVLDPYRINYEALDQQVRLLLNTTCITVVKSAENKTLTQAVIHNLLTCTALLPWSYTIPLQEPLLTLAGQDTTTITLIQKQARQQKRQNYWEKYKIILAIITALALCICFYLLQ